MHTITVPQNEIQGIDEDGVQAKKNFFWFNLKNIINQSLKRMEGLEAANFIKDIYEPLREPLEKNATVFTVEKERDFKKLKELVDHNKFGWVTLNPIEDIPAIIGAFQTAEKE